MIGFVAVKETEIRKKGIEWTLVSKTEIGIIEN